MTSKVLLKHESTKRLIKKTLPKKAFYGLQLRYLFFSLIVLKVFGKWYLKQLKATKSNR